MRKIKNIISYMRLEEFMALLFLVPSFLVTLRANWYFWEMEGKIPRKFYGGIWRIVVTIIVAVLFYYFVKKKFFWKYTYWLRDVMPFVFCVAIYTNLHDTIHFVNPCDIHGALIEMDGFLFGVQPCVWAQKFYHPWLTDYFSVSYMNYFIICVIVVLYLLFKKKDEEARKTLLGTILCFYFGYFLYVVFPAAPPRLTLADQFIRNFSGGWLTSAQNKIVNINPSSSRAAFPSLHCAVTLISLIYSYKYSKPLFILMLIPGISLVLATVYLRHHYVVDIIAGFALAVFSYWAAPKLDAFWKEKRVLLRR